MPSANRITTPVDLDIAMVEGRYAELDDYTVSFETYKEDADPAPFFAGLPDDRCQCPHWGFVTSGQITFRYADHDETYVEGDAYYVPAGHTPVVTAGTTTVEFSLTPELEATLAVVQQNLAKAGIA
jgi:hypothetical protein